MKICLDCSNRFSGPSWRCPVCFAVPSSLDGFLAFAPETASAIPGFDQSHYEKLSPLEAASFWFTARNRLLIWALGTYFPRFKSLLEIGCGTGFVLAGIRRAFPHAMLSGSEILSAGLQYAERRLDSTSLFQMDACQIPFEAEFDVIGAFDVLEHIQEDQTVLSEMYRATAKGGGIVLTVPQHEFLWSASDEFACHVRRYSSRDLLAKVRAAGFTIVRSTSFVSLPLPLMTLSRLRGRTRRTAYDPMAELRIGGLVNNLLGGILRLELALIRAGVSMPMGGSLLVVARKEP